MTATLWRRRSSSSVFGDCATRVEDLSVLGVGGADAENMKERIVGLVREVARLMLHLGNVATAFCEKEQLSVLRKSPRQSRGLGPSHARSY
eukprot:2641011-Pyramimonas_sp.AAC.1